MKYRLASWFYAVIMSSLFLSMFSPLLVIYADETAAVLSYTAIVADRDVTGALSDDSYETYEVFEEGDSLVLEMPALASFMYIEWYQPPGEWNLLLNDGTSQACGKDGFLHELVSFHEPSSQVTIHFPRHSAITGITFYSDGTLPEDVEVWQKQLERADILVFSTHADDEVLFLGPALITALNEGYSVEVVYMTNYWNGEIVREHEKLDGLWAMGIHHDPVNGSFDDVWSDSLEMAKSQYDENAVKAFVVDQIRKFEPQVVITQDFNGEYGHGAHMLLVESVAEAVSHSFEETYFPESFHSYGSWNVAKTYMHFYSENPIVLDCEIPMNNYQGKTALEIAKEAYQKHQTQQKWNLYVTDDDNDENSSVYNCKYFGLYRTTVGSDHENRMMEHIVRYADQEESILDTSEPEASRTSEATTTEPENSDHSIIILCFVVLTAILCALVLLVILGKRRRKRIKR